MPSQKLARLKEAHARVLAQTPDVPHGNQRLELDHEATPPDTLRSCFAYALCAPPGSGSSPFSGSER
jgi:hypothetical protein